MGNKCQPDSALHKFAPGCHGNNNITLINRSVLSLTSSVIPYVARWTFLYGKLNQVRSLMNLCQ